MNSLVCLKIAIFNQSISFYLNYSCVSLPWGMLINHTLFSNIYMEMLIGVPDAMIKDTKKWNYTVVIALKIV